MGMLRITYTPGKELQLFMGVMMAIGLPLQEIPFAWYQPAGSLHRKNSPVPLSQVKLKGHSHGFVLPLLYRVSLKSVLVTHKTLTTINLLRIPYRYRGRC